jgi:peptide/nickel transport system permease protein
MASYTLRRLLISIPALLGILIISFLITRLVPGHPCDWILTDKGTPEMCERVIQAKGLDKSLPVQFGIYIKDVFQGNFGISIRYHRPALQILAERLPATVELGLAAFLISVLIGIPVGILSAMKRNSAFDVLSLVGANLGVSTPVFWLALILMYIFAVLFRDTPLWLPPAGRVAAGVSAVPFYEIYGLAAVEGSLKHFIYEFFSNLYIFNSIITWDLDVLRDTLHHLILPAVTLSIIPMAIIARLTRASLLDEMGQLYILGARAKGLRRQMAITKHGLPNALLPVVIILGLQIGGLISSAILTETIYAFPGLGRMLYESIIAHDYPVIQMIILVIALLYIMANLLVDLAYAALDPRVRLE